ncbi:hypothetical protein RB213_015959 [Colletotrichum asianum]
MRRLLSLLLTVPVIPVSNPVKLVFQMGSTRSYLQPRFSAHQSTSALHTTHLFRALEPSEFFTPIGT